MTDLRDAARQALEALEEATNYTGCEAWSPSMTDECLAVAVALKAALEQPEQEQEPKSTWQKLYEAAIDQRNKAVALNQELLEALKLIASAENSALDLAYCKGIARAAIRARGQA